MKPTMILSLVAASCFSTPCVAGILTITQNNPLEISFRDLPFINSNPEGWQSQGGVSFLLDNSNTLNDGETLILELFNDEAFAMPVSFGAIGNKITYNTPTDSFGVGVLGAFQSGFGAIRLSAIGATSVIVDSIYVQIITPNNIQGGFITVPTPATISFLALAGLCFRRRRI